MILVIRISGMIGIPTAVRKTLYRIGLRRKYSAILLESNNENNKLLKRIRDYVSYGEIEKNMLERLIELRGESLEKKKIDSKKVASGVSEKGLKNLGLKPFFRLHPPRKGIESKKHFGVGKGVLGDNKKKINKLLERML